MRVWLAGLFVFVGILLAATLLDRVPLYILVPVLVIFIFILCLMALILFNLFPKKPGPPTDLAQYLRELEEQGLLASTDYQATRAFQVQESEDEGPHLFLELHDGSVLYLNGQHFYSEGEEEYEEDEENRKEQTNREEVRVFPCTDFTIKRHRQQGWVADLICRGRFLDFETLPPEFWNDFDAESKFPLDGEIITSRTYDQLRNAG